MNHARRGFILVLIQYAITPLLLLSLTAHRSLLTILILSQQVVIMLVIDKENDRVLLSRQSRFVPRMWSCLAGFIEVPLYPPYILPHPSLLVCLMCYDYVFVILARRKLGRGSEEGNVGRIWHRSW